MPQGKGNSEEGAAQTHPICHFLNPGFLSNSFKVSIWVSNTFGQNTRVWRAPLRMERATKVCTSKCKMARVHTVHEPIKGRNKSPRTKMTTYQYITICLKHVYKNLGGKNVPFHFGPSYSLIMSSRTLFSSENLLRSSKTFILPSAPRFLWLPIRHSSQASDSSD